MKTNIINVVYNASSNELVRTNTLVKNAIIYVDSTPFKKWYLDHYGIDLGKRTKRGDDEEVPDTIETAGKSKELISKFKKRNVDRFIDPNVKG